MRIGRRRLAALAAFLTLLAAASPYRGQSLPTVKLAAETVQAFQGYVRIQEGLHDQRVNGRRPFLRIDDPPRHRSLVEKGERIWLGGRDSNPDRQIQSLLSYR